MRARRERNSNLMMKQVFRTMLHFLYKVYIVCCNKEYFCELKIICI
jgi:hypothetical protein